MKNAYCLLVFCSLLFARYIYAQGSDEKYDLLMTELQLYASYSTLPESVSALIDSAARYAKNGDYDFALVYLEQARGDLPEKPIKKTPEINPQKPSHLSYYFQSGVDFNRQEFELGFDQSDSTLLEQVNKPFVGFGFRLNGTDGSFLLEDHIRYDKENLDNDFSIRNHWQGRVWSLDGFNGYIYDNNFLTPSLGYHEVYSRWMLRYRSDNLDLTFGDDSRYKRYFEPSSDVPDYFRNTFASNLSYQFNSYHSLRLQYSFDYNQSIQTSNNDYADNRADVEYDGVWFDRLKIRFPVDVEDKKFSYILNDSLLNNTALTFTVNPQLDYHVTDFFTIGMAYRIDKKNYRIKTEQDPDYTYAQFSPELKLNFTDEFQLGIGYVLENKQHVLQPGLEDIYISEQNYRAQGIIFSFDITKLSGLLLSFDASYTKRRYPDAVAADNFSIYANRNVLSLLTFAQWPIMEKLLLNIIVSYDNDKDLDSDFNDSRSSYYTLDLKYEF